MNVITLEMLRQHVVTLWGGEQGIEWVDSWREPTAHFDTGTVTLHPIAREEDYAVALHEIGHIRNGPEEQEVVVDERRAWDWARANALVWTPAMER
jgi:hypothetical protein